MTRSLLIALLLAIGLTACGKKEEAASAPAASAVAPAPASAPAEAPAAEETPAE